MHEWSEFYRDALYGVAKLMAISAVTAPKARGIDNIVVKVLSDKSEIDALAKTMESLASEYENFFARDAASVRSSPVVVLIGCRIVKTGIKQPKEIEIDIDTALSLVNLGIAVGSAVKTASMLNVDNRIMYSIGVAAKRQGLLNEDVVLGIPLSATSKSIYFDRTWPPK
uniref:Ferredoxin n=1 Tax=Fervidicoccus fontis TaxID=683846 RepID=A0A7J3ZLT7_9CREN